MKKEIGSKGIKGTKSAKRRKTKKKSKWFNNRIWKGRKLIAQGWEMFGKVIRKSWKF